MLKYLSENKEWLFSGIGIVILGIIFTVIRVAWNLERGTWVYFFGIAIFIIILIILYRHFANRNSQNKKEDSAEDTATPISSTSENSVMEANLSPRLANIRPDQILEEISKRPLLQQEESARHYIGLMVVWRLSVFSIYDSYADSNMLTVLAKEPTIPDAIMHRASVSFDVVKNSYPGMGLLKDGDVVNVTGRIRKINVNLIELANAKVSF